MGGYYDRAGNPITLEEWGKLIEARHPKRVARDVVGHITVSTVWLGLDHSFGLGGPPLIFETMVFGGAHDQEMWRYSTEEEARFGHDSAVTLVRGDYRPTAWEYAPTFKTRSAHR